MPKITLDGDKIRRLRVAQDLSQAELAERCGFGGHSLISKVESDSEHGVMLETAGLIADALGVPLDLIIERRYDPPPQASTQTTDYAVRRQRIERILELAEDLPPDKLEFVLKVAETQLHIHRQEELEKEKAAQASED
jgi:transcriptional regulator with XRE-family HTH domain